MLTPDSRRHTFHAVILVGLLCVAAEAAAMKLRLEGIADASGRLVTGQLVTLGTTPYKLDLMLADAVMPPAQIRSNGEVYDGAITAFHLDMPNLGVDVGGLTAFNTVDTQRGDGGNDVFGYFVGDCATTNCPIMGLELGNSVPLGFEGLFGFIELPGGTIPVTSSLGELAGVFAAGQSPVGPSLINLNYVPADLLPASLAAVGEELPDIRFFFLEGNVSNVTLVPLPPSLLLLGAPLLLGAVMKRRA